MILSGIFVLLGILAGNGAVYVFNRIPVSWLCDYGQEPDAALRAGDRQRINSHPWKALFSALFVMAGIKLGVEDPFYAAPALAAMWTLLEIAVADCKYMIIPDQFVILLAVTSFGFVPYYPSLADPVLGALLGGGCMLLVSAAGKLIFRREALGFGDVKLFAAAGLLLGLYGTAVTLILASFLSCIFYGGRLLGRKIKRGDMQPLAPFIAAAAAFYLVFS